MIAYNVTINVNTDIDEEFLMWMKNEHLPEVMQTGMFNNYNMYKLLSKQPDEEGSTYVVQYFTNNIELYERYQHEFAPKLQLKTKEKFGNKVLAFRTLMELILQQFK